MLGWSSDPRVQAKPKADLILPSRSIARFTQPANYPTPPTPSPLTTLTYPQIVANSLTATSETHSSDSTLVLDARAHPRFTGEAPEPRPGLPSGHIPGSKSLPFSELVKDGKLLEDAEVSMWENAK